MSTATDTRINVPEEKAVCAIDGCDRTVRCRDLCGLHYGRLQRTGTTDPRSHLSEDQRFWLKVNKFGPISSERPELGPCWVWLSALLNTGYGHFHVGSRKNGSDTTILAHRWSYQWAHGSIPDGFDIDHLCRNPACVNPSHLEAVTHQENMLRGRGMASRNHSVAHCPQGHPYDKENTFYRSNGSRGCRRCREIRNKARYRKPEAVG